MKTKILQEIDGYKIIVGIGDAQIDGEATKPIVAEKIIDTDEYKAVKSKQDEMLPWMIQVKESTQKFHATNNKPEKEKYTYEYKQARAKLVTLEEELKQIVPALKNKYTELTRAHAIYFKMVNAELITEDESEKIIDLKKSAELNGFHLDTDLKSICDNRGIIAWSKSDKWSSRKITKIGDEIKIDEVTESELNGSQIAEIKQQLEIERVSKLSLSEKKAEYDKATSILQEQAAIKKSGLIISGVSESDATKQAGGWYNSELEKLNVIYA